jgi:hypothetical protein
MFKILTLFCFLLLFSRGIAQVKMPETIVYGSIEYFYQGHKR